MRFIGVFGALVEYHQCIEGYHDVCGDIMSVLSGSVHWEGGSLLLWNTPNALTISPNASMTYPQFTDDMPDAQCIPGVSLTFEFVARN